ncbi:MAG: hypothetical protein GY750_11715 [Lentisphaerae bacterium]|nr:hypothetical protein [Lentisphaerota bacterium]MCP4102081.1 hypothetical protein [Lentisphaerota bacterium]
MNEFILQYADESNKTLSPVSAITNAVDSYIRIRQQWVTQKKTGLGWRGSFKSGRLFFNRSKTHKNIKIMQDIKNILEDRVHSYDYKIYQIKEKCKHLSSHGMARQLIDKFLESSISRNRAYLNSELTRSNSVYIENHRGYDVSDILGQGQDGVVKRLMQRNGNNDLVLKTMTGKNVNKQALLNEVSIFKEVYDTLGRPYFNIDSQVRLLDNIPFHNQCGMTMPEIPGTSLSDYVLTKEYDEEMVFYAVFKFLWILHEKLQIIHGDAHTGNIMILDFYNVFFIDFGRGKKFYMQDNQFHIDVAKDLAAVVSQLLVCRNIKGIKCNQSLAQIIDQYGLYCWFTNFFDGNLRSVQKFLAYLNSMLDNFYKGFIINDQIVLKLGNLRLQP